MTTPAAALDRRRFLLFGLSAAFPGRLPAGAAPSALALPAPARPVLDFAIAGGFYHGLAAVAGAIAPGERLQLRPEPENPHDRFAVAVLRRGAKLGYVPRAASERVSRLLSAGGRLAVEVVGPLDPPPDRSDLADLVYTGFAAGDPRLRLVEEG